MTMPSQEAFFHVAFSFHQLSFSHHSLSVLPVPDALSSHSSRVLYTVFVVVTLLAASRHHQILYCCIPSLPYSFLLLFFLFTFQPTVFSQIRESLSCPSLHPCELFITLHKRLLESVVSGNLPTGAAPLPSTTLGEHPTLFTVYPFHQPTVDSGNIFFSLPTALAGVCISASNTAITLYKVFESSESLALIAQPSIILLCHTPVTVSTLSGATGTSPSPQACIIRTRQPY